MSPFLKKFWDDFEEMSARSDKRVSIFILKEEGGKTINGCLAISCLVKI